MHKIRIGHGYDVHRLVENRKLILGGVEIPWEKGLLAHLNGDCSDILMQMSCCMPFLMLCWERLHWVTSASISQTLTLAMLEQIVCCF